MGGGKGYKTGGRGPTLARGSGGVSPQEMQEEGLRGAAAEGVRPRPGARRRSRSQEAQLLSHKGSRVSAAKCPFSFSFLDRPCASSAPGSVLRCPGTYTDLLAFPPGRSTASSPVSSASSSPDPGLGPARPGRRLQFVRSLPSHHPMAAKLLCHQTP